MEESLSTTFKNNNITFNEEKRNDSISIQENIDISKNDDAREFKIVLIGNASVGKTSIFNKFIMGDFSQNYKSTITVEFRSKYLKVDKNLFVKLVLWDTCGTEIFRAVTKQYYKGAHAIILVFDLTDQNSFNDLTKWLKDVNNYADKDIKILVAGNKLDLIEERKVSETQAINFCREKGFKYIEVSAKEGTNILKIFEELSFELAKNDEKKREEEMNSQFMMENFDDKNILTKNNKKFGCC